MRWIIDPNTGKESVTVTLLVIACFLMVFFIFLEYFIPIRSTYLLDEFFGGCMALYGGKMITRGRDRGRLEREELPCSGNDISPK